MLTPGILHIEMNSCKAFLGLNWEVFVCEVVKLLGFKSDRAISFAKKCSDHHKTWQILEIMYLAIADELFVPFV